MTKLNWNRIVLGGLAAGVALVLMDMITMGGIFNAQISAAMASIGLNWEDGGPADLAFMIAFNLIVSFFAVWLYAHLKTRYGPGPRTALIVGLVVWVSGYVQEGLTLRMIFPTSVVGIVLMVGLVEALVVSQIGAYLYRD